MLSLVSYVCLGMCAGMWVISGGIYLGVLVLSFVSVLLFQRSGHVLTSYYVCVCVCVCSFSFYSKFEDVFSSTMWSDLRAAVPQGSGVLLNPMQVLFRVLRWLAELPVLPPSIFLLTTDGGLGHENMA